MTYPIAYLHKFGPNDKGEVSDTSLAPADFDDGWTQEELVPKSELDEADRRAVVLQRLLDYEKSKTAARESWLRKAKEEWGVSNYISFDHVWEEALALKKAADANSKHNPQE